MTIYGGQERFVAEYRQLLAERLLAARDFDTDKEVRLERREMEGEGGRTEWVHVYVNV